MFNEIQLRKVIKIMEFEELIPSSDYLPITEFAKQDGTCYQTVSKRIKANLITDYIKYKNRLYVHKKYIKQLNHYILNEVETPEGYISRKQILKEIDINEFALSRLIASGVLGQTKTVKRHVFVKLSSYNIFKDAYLKNKEEFNNGNCK